jgi:peptide-methionine (R)-S-oxide reductase
MRTFSKDPDAISRLSPDQYRVTQQSGTERPGTGEYLDNKEPGIYIDIVSGEPLLVSLQTRRDSPSHFILPLRASWPRY